MRTGGGPHIRLATEDDAAACLAIYAPVVEATAVSFELEPPSVLEMRGRIRSTLERTPWLVAEDRSAVWGYAYAGPFRARPAYQWTTEATVYVHPDHQGKGVGRALYTALLAALRAADYRNVVGGITLPNPASVALHEGLGFRPRGAILAAGFKLGGWHDVGFWQIQLRGDASPGGTAACPGSAPRHSRVGGGHGRRGGALVAPLNTPSPLRVSAVVPARDAGRTLASVLRALQAALPPGAELLVVDDGSADDTGTVAAGCGVRVLRTEHAQGPAAARNRGAQATTGEVLVFVDADCRPHEDAVALLLGALEDKAVAAAFGSYDDRPEADTFVSLYKNLAHHFVHQGSAAEAQTFWAGLGAVRRDVFRDAGGFDEAYGRPSIEDVELGYRLKAAGHRIVLVKGAQVTHLKRWSLGSWLVSDLRDRALPWARLLRAGRPLPRSLNFTWRDRAASSLVALFWLLLAGAGLLGAPWRSPLLEGAVLALGLGLALDLAFFRFASRRVSLGFAIAALGFQVLHRTAGTLGLVLGFLGPQPKKAEPASTLRS